MTTAKAAFTLFCCMLFAMANAQGSQPAVDNPDNGLTFTVTGCVGDATAQRATVFFTISNPSKPNQKLTIGSLYPHKEIVALDSNSKTYKCTRAVLADDAVEGGYYGIRKTKELPSGLSIKGSVTFSNVLTSVKSFAVVNIYETVSDWDGGKNSSEGFVEVKNLAINWGGRP